MYEEMKGEPHEVFFKYSHDSLSTPYAIILYENRWVDLKF
jgi:hypothetical protein